MSASSYPRKFIADSSGQPLENGDIYIGEANQDPETNPVQVYWDAGLSIPASQPLSVSTGYVMNGGSRADFYTAEEAYSIRLRDGSGVQVDYIPSVPNGLLGVDGSGQIGFSHSESYAPGTAGTKLQQFTNPLDAPYNAVGNGSADDRAALAAADAAAYGAGRPLFITGRHRIASDLTLQSDLSFMGGALEPASGTTVTCRGAVSGPLSQIFAGAGSVVGVRWVRPEWFGAVRDAVTDDSDALNKAWACVAASASSRGARPTIQFAAGVYGLASVFRVAPALTLPLKMVGEGWAVGGTRFQVLSTFDDTDGDMALHVDGSTDAIHKSTSIEIGDFAVIPYTAGASNCKVGMQIGAAGKDLIGVQQSQIRDIHFADGFDEPLRLTNFRLIDFNRVSTWNRTLTGAHKAINFISDTTGPMFCGDINFNSCQFSGWLGAGLIALNPSHDDYQIKGVRFNNCIFYHSDVSIDISPNNSAIVGDIWINPGCQFDGWQKRVIRITPTGAGSVVDCIHIMGTYFRGIEPGWNVIEISSDGSSRVDAIWVNDNWFANILDGSRAVAISNAKNVHVDGNSLTECYSTGAEMILLNNVWSFTCEKNTLSQVTPITVDYLISLGTGCDYGSVAGNSTGGHAAVQPVRNLSSGAHLTLSPNW